MSLWPYRVHWQDADGSWQSAAPTRHALRQAACLSEGCNVRRTCTEDWFAYWWGAIPVEQSEICPVTQLHFSRPVYVEQHGRLMLVRDWRVERGRRVVIKTAAGWACIVPAFWERVWQNIRRAVGCEG